MSILKVNGMDKYGYIGIETLLNFCENSKDHAVTPNDFMRMNRLKKPERKTGQWIPDDSCYSEMRFICSQCKKSEAVPTTRFVDYYKPIWNFCPHCGARMWG